MYLYVNVIFLFSSTSSSRYTAVYWTVTVLFFWGIPSISLSFSRSETKHSTDAKGGWRHNLDDITEGLTTYLRLGAVARFFAFFGVLRKQRDEDLNPTGKMSGIPLEQLSRNVSETESPSELGVELGSTSTQQVLIIGLPFSVIIIRSVRERFKRRDTYGWITGYCSVVVKYRSRIPLLGRNIIESAH